MYARRRSARATPTPQVDDLPRVGQPVAGGTAPGDDGEISLVDFWHLLRRFRGLVLVATLVGTVLLGGVALITAPVYRAETLLSPVTDIDKGGQLPPPLGEFGNLAAMAGIGLDDKNRKNEAIATLRSRQFTEQFIEDNKLRPLLFADLWDADQGDWNAGLDAERVPTLWDAYKKFNDSVRHLREDRATGMLTLSIEWHDPQTAADWANQLVARVNASMRARAEESSEQAIAYLQQQLQQTAVVDLQQVLHSLIEAEMKKIILANIREEFAFKVIDPAVEPQEPVRPRLLPMLVLGLLGGTLAGILLALVLNAAYLRRRPVEADAAVSLPVDSSSR